MFARYSSNYRILVAGMAFLAGLLSLQAQVPPVDQTVTGSLTVEGSTILHGTLDVGTQALPQGVTIHGDTDIFGNIFSLGHSLTDPVLSGLEIYIKNLDPTTRFIEQVTTLDGTTFRWGTRSNIDDNGNLILDDFGTQWMSLNREKLEVSGKLLVNPATAVAGSFLLDLQVGGVSKFSVDNAGAIVAAGNLNVSAGLSVGGEAVLTQAAAVATYLSKAALDPNNDGKIDTAQLTGVAPLSITNTTSATSSTTGALKVSGGLGVAMDSWINGVRIGRGAGSSASNTALGAGVLNVNTSTSYYNTASGYYALYSNTTGAYNTANGSLALYSNDSGGANTASGSLALYSNSTGIGNIATGTEALYNNTTGSGNVANGNGALYSNASSGSNATAGYYDSSGNPYDGYSGTYEPSGDYYYTYYDSGGYYGTTDIYYYNNGLGNYYDSNGNPYDGYSGSYDPIGDYYWATGSVYYPNNIYTYYYYNPGSYVDGNYNTASGYQALYSNVTGDKNIALGYAAGAYKADGGALTTPNNSIYLGSEARGYDDNDDNSIVIGYQAVGEGAYTTVIGNAQTTSAHIYGQLNSSGVNVSGNLNVQQNATVTGQLIISTPSGGIDMGEFGNPPQ